MFRNALKRHLLVARINNLRCENGLQFIKRKNEIYANYPIGFTTDKNQFISNKS